MIKTITILYQVVLLILAVTSTCHLTPWPENYIYDWPKKKLNLE